MAAMPIYGKNHTTSPESPSRFGLYFAGSILGTSLNKELKSFRSDHVQTLYGWGKFYGKRRSISDTWTFRARKPFLIRLLKQGTDYMHEAFMKIIWQLWLPWQPFIKNSNGTSYEITEPILMKFHI